MCCFEYCKVSGVLRESFLNVSYSTKNELKCFLYYRSIHSSLPPLFPIILWFFFSSFLKRQSVVSRIGANVSGHTWIQPFRIPPICNTQSVFTRYKWMVIPHTLFGIFINYDFSSRMYENVPIVGFGDVFLFLFFIFVMFCGR